MLLTRKGTATMSATYRPTNPAPQAVVDLPGQQPSTPRQGAPATNASRAFRYVAALLRISLGWVFLWAFIDKMFALGYSTGRDPGTGIVDTFGPDAWLHGGSPTLGFLKFGTAGPFAGFYQGFAGAAWADWLFMAGLLGIGLAVMLGIAMRLATAAGAVMLVLMWSAALPPSANPFMDDHLVYALALVALMLAGAGRTLGLGRAWERLGPVRDHGLLR
jgi:thiosulfate dehydrogenase (quinone) large subunit